MSKKYREITSDKGIHYMQSFIEAESNPKLYRKRWAKSFDAGNNEALKHFHGFLQNKKVVHNKIMALYNNNNIAIFPKQVGVG